MNLVLAGRNHYDEISDMSDPTGSGAQLILCSSGHAPFLPIGVLTLNGLRENHG